MTVSYTDTLSYDQELQEFSDGRCIQRHRPQEGFPADLIKVARRKLRYLHAAHMLVDLRVPPGDRLEALKGDRAGQHSIRVNDQFRICFVWTAEG
jgi:plasmid maintenance system killer protein